MILKLSKVLSVEEVKGPYMHTNQRLILIQKWYDTRDIQLTAPKLELKDGDGVPHEPLAAGWGSSPKEVAGVLRSRNTKKTIYFMVSS